MTRHYNRNSRRAGGDKRFKLIVPLLKEQEMADRLIGLKIEQNPHMSLKDIGDWAHKYAGIPKDNIIKTLEKYCE